jgi:hypothetical protein
MRESKFQADFIKKVEELFPECIVLKIDKNYLQGFPDRIFLFRSTYAVLEFKDEENADRQPNQEYYVDLLGRYAYANFVYPENEEKVLRELQAAFRTRR